MMPGMGKLFLRALLQATAWAHAMTFSALRGQSRPHGAGPGAVLVAIPLLLAVTPIPAVSGTLEEPRDWLEAAVAGNHRDPEQSARDIYRQPLEVLRFFGLKPGSSVVEIWPSGGWWTEILAPALRDEGIYYAAGFALTARRTPQWRKTAQRRFAEWLQAQPELYDAVVVTELSVPERTVIAPIGSTDFVLTFRNVHNWLNGGYAAEMFEVMARALRPGGVLGVVTHRAPAGRSIEAMQESGYVTEALVIEMAEAAGLSLEASSEINANPRDDRDHPAGVWTLPPSLAHCREMQDDSERAACEADYRAIGESDRMTLKFRKIAAAD